MSRGGLTHVEGPTGSVRQRAGRDPDKFQVLSPSLLPEIQAAMEHYLNWDRSRFTWIPCPQALACCFHFGSFLGISSANRSGTKVSRCFFAAIASADEEPARFTHSCGSPRKSYSSSVASR